MYKVLLVDDERIIRLALNSIISWEQEGFAVCGSVSSGKDALKQIELQQPNLIVTDIVMPEMDGISLIKKARSLGYSGEFILLTNYQDFSYAVTALKNGVFDYVLKTDLTPESFLPLLRRVRKKLDALPQTKSNHLSPDFDLERITDFLRTPSLTSTSITTFSHPHLFLQVFLRDELFKTSTDEASYALKSIIDDTLKGLNFFTLSISSSRTIILVPHDKPISELSSYLERLREHVKLYMNTDCGFVLSRSFSNTYELQTSLNNCKGCCFLAVYQGFGYLLYEQDYDSYFSVPLFTAELYSKIQKSIDDSEYKRAIEDFESFWQECMERHISPQDACTASATLQNLLLINNSLWIEHAAQDSSISSFRTFFPCTMQEHIQYFSEMLSIIQQARAKFSLSSCREEIAQLDDFIHEHLSEHITLSMLSKHVNMTENYLSRLFKSETGINIITYINLVKLEHARVMLAQPSSSIKSIALKLGFEEPSYFNKLFNKVYGINPSDYKKLLLLHQN